MSGKEALLRLFLCENCASTRSRGNSLRLSFSVCVIEGRAMPPRGRGEGAERQTPEGPRSTRNREAGMKIMAMFNRRPAPRRHHTYQ